MGHKPPHMGNGSEARVWGGGGLGRGGVVRRPTGRAAESETAAGQWREPASAPIPCRAGAWGTLPSVNSNIANDEWTCMVY